MRRIHSLQFSLSPLSLNLSPLKYAAPTTYRVVEVLAEKFVEQ